MAKHDEKNRGKKKGKDAGAGDRALVDYFFSLGMLKRTERSGWRTIGLKHPESVADHTYGAALVGMALARLEGADEAKVLKMCLIHDMHELRLGDINKVNKRYVKADQMKAFRETVRGAPGADEMMALFKEYCAARTPEARIAKEADALDMMLEAKFLLDTGNPYARDWIASAWKKVSTKSGKRLAAQIEKKDSLDWLMRLFDGERKRGMMG